MAVQNLMTIHPGRVLLEDFLAPRGISVSRLANDIGVPVRYIYELVQGQRSINSDLAHRLAHYFGLSERYWLELQLRYDRDRVKERSATIQNKQILRRTG